jgi:hypothetical protein
VTVLHSQDEILLFDPTVWLHFTIAPEDFELILTSESWSIDNLSFDGVDNAQVEDWWNPELLGDYTKYQVWIEDCDCRKEMWVNEERKEVYFRVAFH